MDATDANRQPPKTFRILCFAADKTSTPGATGCLTNGPFITATSSGVVSFSATPPSIVTASIQPATGRRILVDARRGGFAYRVALTDHGAAWPWAVIEERDRRGGVLVRRVDDLSGYRLPPASSQRDGVAVVTGVVALAAFAVAGPAWLVIIAAWIMIGLAGLNDGAHGLVVFGAAIGIGRLAALLVRWQFIRDLDEAHA